MAEAASAEGFPDGTAEDVRRLIQPRRRRDDTEMDITPMIDCTFLLLIFFLLTFKSEEAAGIRLPPARHGVAVPSKNAVVLTIMRGGGDRPAKVCKGNTTDPSALVESSDLKAMEEEISAYVEKEMARGVRPAEFILVKAAEDVKHRDVASVLRAVSRVAEVQQLYVAVSEVQ
jgi:biopolymer transport protein ExbD